MATIQQKMTKKGLQALFLENETFFMTFEVGQEVSGINLQGFHISVWERG